MTRSILSVSTPGAIRGAAAKAGPIVCMTSGFGRATTDKLAESLFRNFDPGRP